MWESRCEYHLTIAPLWVKSYPALPSDLYRRVPPERYPCPDRDHSAPTLLRRHYRLHLFFHRLHIDPLLHFCPAPTANGVNVLFRQLPCKFTPIICASTGSMLIARSWCSAS